MSRAVDGVRLAVDELAGLMRGRVRVGTVVSITSPNLDVAGLLADFRRDHPKVELSFSEDNSDRMVEALRDGRLDVAFIGLGSATPEGIESRLVVAVGRGDPLDGRDAVALEAIRDRDLKTLPADTSLRSAIDDACAEAGFRPRITFEGSDPTFLARFVGRGLGVALLPESIAKANPEELHAIAITHPRPCGRIALAWRAEGPISPAARALIGRARDVLADSSTDH